MRRTRRFGKTQCRLRSSLEKQFVGAAARRVLPCEPIPKRQLLAAFGRVTVGIRRDRGQIITFGFSSSWISWIARSSCWSSPRNSFAGIVIDHDVGINAVAFDDPVFAVFRIRARIPV